MDMYDKVIATISILYHHNHHCHHHDHQHAILYHHFTLSIHPFISIVIPMESISCLQHLNAQGDIITKSFLNNNISTATLYNNDDDDSHNGHDSGSIDRDIYLTHSCINIKQQYHHPHNVVDHVISIQLPPTPDYIMRLADLMDLIVTNQLYLLPTGYRHHSTVDGSSSCGGGGNSTNSSTNNDNNNNNNNNNNSNNSTDDKINHDNKNDDNDKYTINTETPSVFRTINKETNETSHGNGHISPHIPSQTTTNSSNTVTFTPMSEYIQHIKETASVNKNYYESIKTSSIPTITTASTTTTTSIAIPPFTTTTSSSSTIVNNDDNNHSINISDNNISTSNSYITPTILTQIEYDRDDENSQIKNLEVFFNSLDDELNSLLTSGNNVTNDRVVTLDGHVTNRSAESSSNNNNNNNNNSSNPDNKQSTHNLNLDDHVTNSSAESSSNNNNNNNNNSSSDNKQITHNDEDDTDSTVNKITILVNSHASISEESSAILPSLHPSSTPHTTSSEEAKPSKKSLSTNIQVMIVMMMMMTSIIL